MITGTNILVLVMMLIGTVGIVVPVLPGLLIVWAATLVWAFEQQTSSGWVVFGVATVAYALGLVSQFLFPGRRLKAAGIDTTIIGLALVVGVVGLFVIPVVGGPLGFIGAIYGLERLKHRQHEPAWSATKQALRAVALNMGIELLTAVAIITTWVIGVWLTRP